MKKQSNKTNNIFKSYSQYRIKYFSDQINKAKVNFDSSIDSALDNAHKSLTKLKKALNS